MSMTSSNYTKGIRRTIKVYPPMGTTAISPETQRRLARQRKGPLLKPHATLQVSVKPHVKGHRT